MPPIRRYLRISRHTVLCVKIYLDNPSLSTSWLLHPSHPVLPSIMAAIKPLVLSKLKEEHDLRRMSMNPNATNTTKKKKSEKKIKDVVVTDEFEVSVFLTDMVGRHSLVVKEKVFSEAGKGGKRKQRRLEEFSGGAGGGEVVVVPDEEDGNDVEVAIREEAEIDDEDGVGVDLNAIPEAPSLLVPDDGEGAATEDEITALHARGSQRRRRQQQSSQSQDGEEQIETDDLFVPSGSDDEDGAPPTKQRRLDPVIPDEEEDGDKKKLGMKTYYDGFAIYGSVLCLVVKKRGDGGRNASSGRLSKGKGRATDAAVTSSGSGKGQAMMEEWIASSTQVPVSILDEDD